MSSLMCAELGARRQVVEKLCFLLFFFHWYGVLEKSNKDVLEISEFPVTSLPSKIFSRTFASIIKSTTIGPCPPSISCNVDLRDLSHSRCL